MISGITLKICGLTTPADAHAAAAIGADYLGFILHPASPRYVGTQRFKVMVKDLPALPKVGVLVYTNTAAVAAAMDAGFDYLQIHFPAETPVAEAASWNSIVAPSRLWLAPRISPGAMLDSKFMALADYFLIDTYDSKQVGGTGRTGDWSAFRALHAQHTSKTWILAGGLNPENVVTAIKSSGTTFVDVNSGVESAPGVKDHGKLQTLKLAMQSLGK